MVMSSNQKELEKRYFGLRSTCFNYLDTSIKLFKQYLDDELEETSNKWSDLGTQTHMYLLQADEFWKNYTYLTIDKPSSEKQKQFAEQVAELIKANKEKNKVEIIEKVYKDIYVIAKKSEDKIKEDALSLYNSLEDYIKYLVTRTQYKDVLSYATVNYLKDVKEEVKKHKVANTLLLQDSITDDIYRASEKQIYWEHPLFNIEGSPIVLRSTIDRLIIDHKDKRVLLIDIKTSSKLPEFEKSFEEYKYNRQLASYWMALEYYLRTEEEYKGIDWNEYTRDTYIIAIQTPHQFRNYPTECKVFPISERSLGTGLKDLNSKIDDVLWHITNNKWDHNRDYYENNGLEKVL